MEFIENKVYCKNDRIFNWVEVAKTRDGKKGRQIFEMDLLGEINRRNHTLKYLCIIDLI